MSTAHMHHHGAWGHGAGGRAWLREARRTNNPLLRRPTPMERLVKLLCIGLLVLATVAAGIACGLVLATGLGAERAQADRRPVSVVVVRPAGSTSASSRYLTAASLEVRYEVDGVTRVSTLPTSFGAVPGAGLHAWADGTGQLVSRPQTRLTTTVQTLLAVVGGLVLLVSLALGGRAGFTAWTDRLRADEWEAEWLEFDTTGHTR